MALLGRDIEGALVAVIADEDTITGFLLAGVGDIDIRKKSNFLVVDSKTTVRDVEAAFKDYTSREDIAIVLISQPIANMIRHVVSTYNKVGEQTGCVWTARDSLSATHVAAHTASKHTVAADLTQDADFRLLNMFLVMLLLPCCSPCQRYWRFPAKTAHMTPTRTPCYGVSSTCWAFREGCLSSTRQLHCIFNCNVQQLRPGRCHPPGAQAEAYSRGTQAAGSHDTSEPATWAALCGFGVMQARYGARRLAVAAVDCTLSPLAQAVALGLQCGNVHVGCCDCGCPCCLEVGRCLSTPWLQVVALCQQQLCCSGHCLRRAVPVVLNGLPQAAGLLLWDVVVTPCGSVLHFSKRHLLRAQQGKLLACLLHLR
jgi:ATP synthase F subunit